MTASDKPSLGEEGYSQPDPTWVECGLELVAKLREDLELSGFPKGVGAPNAYLCGADVPGLVAYVDSLVADHRRCAERNGDLTIQVIELKKAVEAEREACAKISDRNDMSPWGIAAEIRARGKES